MNKTTNKKRIINQNMDKSHCKKISQQRQQHKNCTMAKAKTKLLLINQ